MHAYKAQMIWHSLTVWAYAHVQSTTTERIQHARPAEWGIFPACMCVCYVSYILCVGASFPHGYFLVLWFSTVNNSTSVCSTLLLPKHFFLNVRVYHSLCAYVWRCDCLHAYSLFFCLFLRNIDSCKHPKTVTISIAEWVLMCRPGVLDGKRIWNYNENIEFDWNG
jgi:hypothetical protein